MPGMQTLARAGLWFLLVISGLAGCSTASTPQNGAPLSYYDGTLFQSPPTLTDQPTVYASLKGVAIPEGKVASIVVTASAIATVCAPAACTPGESVMLSLRRSGTTAPFFTLPQSFGVAGDVQTWAVFERDSPGAGTYDYDVLVSAQGMQAQLDFVNVDLEIVTPVDAP